MDTRPKQSSQRNRPDSRPGLIDSAARRLNERVSAQNGATQRQSGRLQVLPDLESVRKKKAGEKQTAMPKVDTQFIRNNHYSHNLRWIVNEDIGFSYGNQLQAGLIEFEKYADFSLNDC